MMSGSQVKSKDSLKEGKRLDRDTAPMKVTKVEDPEPVVVRQPTDIKRKKSSNSSQRQNTKRGRTHKPKELSEHQ